MATETRERDAAWNPMEFVAHWFRDQFSEHTDVTCQSFPSNNDNTHSSHKNSYQRVKHLEKDPYITLYYDEDKQKTIAVLSRPTEALGVYFSCRVAQGTAQQTSILYYELDGFIRENFTNLRRQHYLGPDSIKLAVGSLEASDMAQKKFLENQRIQQCSQTNDFDMLEEVMEICRQHWLEEDLDALSIFFLAQVNRTMNRIAKKIVRRRRRELKVFVTPYVDGASISGYSNFTRSNSHNLVRQMESGRSVEYSQSSPIQLNFTSDQQYAPNSLLPNTFAWACEEVALGNLHQWGDISKLEYVGQKLVVSCMLHPADSDGEQTDRPSPTALSCVRLEANPRSGKREWPYGFVILKIEILNSKMRRLDEVAISYA